jgi:hypothetical protein
MAALIEEERLDENFQPVKRRSTTHRQSKRKVKPRKTANVNSGMGHDDDDDDENYSGSHSDVGSGSLSKDDSDIEMISNDEVNMLSPLYDVVLTAQVACGYAPFENGPKNETHKVDHKAEGARGLVNPPQEEVTPSYC